jgi:hypothetical protein
MSGLAKLMLVAAFVAGAAVVFYSSRAQAEARRQWFENSKTAGCKRTGFTAQRPFRGIWTCPDGTAYLEPRGADE